MNSIEMFFNIWENRVLGNKEDLVIGLNQLEQEIRADERAKILEKVRDLTFREVNYTDSLNDRTEFRELLDELVK